MTVSYRDAGVDIDTGNELVQDIRKLVGPTMRPEVIGGVGGFASLVRIPAGYREPVLVSGTDGVGTKLKLAIQTGRHETIGIDLVAMCANDILVCGAEPLFFLDYYATGRLRREVAAQVIAGIAEGCRQAGCALVGGETAEMPGMYGGEDYDLAGFCVGVVEAGAIIDGSRVRPGDVMIGLRSSGVHSNGFSLVRKLIELRGADLSTTVGGQPLIDALLAPTRIYVPSIRALLAEVPVHAMAHITGGGLPENLPRVLPDNCVAVIDRGSWDPGPLFRWLAGDGEVEQAEMDRTFNCGVGFVVVVDEINADAALDQLRASGETAWVLGRIERGERGVRYQ